MISGFFVPWLKTECKYNIQDINLPIENVSKLGYGKCNHSTFNAKAMSMSHCVLLNADYSFLNFIDWKRAMRLIAKEKVKILSYSEQRVCSGEGNIFKIPSVMRLVKLVKTLYQLKSPFNKKNVLVRDGFLCAYCGNTKPFLTVDHVIPKSKGGKTSFENCVACCRPCNNEKGNRTPKEAGLKLKVKTYHPSISEILKLKAAQSGILETLTKLGIY
ncbi:MAG: HNH endonuclease [Desulfobacteraceae bacterium]|nr:HNH endonuclease [Desulfobacteraceae bacterium]